MTDRRADSPPIEPAPSRNFRGIEGARGWLAWGVVVSHLFLINGANTYAAPLKVFPKLGDWAVATFIIISGFVITNLVITKREPYLTYITRRGLRIYPAYLVSLALAVWVASVTTGTLSSIPWGDPGQIWFSRMQVQEVANGHRFLHIAAHLLLAHGAISNRLLNQSQFMFLAPAWSLSLEWQFYLIAPPVVRAVSRPAGRAVVFAITVLGTVAFLSGVFGAFLLPSILPGAGLLFLLGIATRFAVEQLPTFERYPVGFAIGSAVLLTLASPNLVPVAMWFGIVAYFRMKSGATGRAARILRSVLDGRAATAMGDRSYSVYVVHWPIVRLAVFLGFGVLHLGRWQTFVLSVVLTVPCVVAASELMYRFVERPFIKLGKRAFSARGARRSAPSSTPVAS